MEQTQTLGKRIAMLRKQNGMTQEQLAEKVGVSAQAVSKWENDISCPDITALPLLASIFQVTVDELLGIKPIEPHVVILEKDRKEEEKKGKGCFSFQFDANSKDERNSYGIGGIITLILILVVLLLQRTTTLLSDDISTWNYIWPLLVFGIGLGGVIEWNRPIPMFSIGLLVIGAYEFVWFALDKPSYLIRLDWLIVVIVLAILLLVNEIIKKLWFKNKAYRTARPICMKGMKEKVSEYSTEDGNLIANMRFSDGVYVFESELLRSAEINTSFSACTFDLSNVEEFADDALLDIRVSFGEVTLLLPENVAVQLKGEASFGARSVRGTPKGDAIKTIYVLSNVSFGNLEIRYPNA